MTGNSRIFLEMVCEEGEAAMERLQKADKDEIIAWAEEKGIALTEEDFTSPEDYGLISDKELEAVTGGKACLCVMAGHGKTGGGDEECICPVAGAGFLKGGPSRCTCIAGGYGESLDTVWTPPEKKPVHGYQKKETNG